MEKARGRYRFVDDLRGLLVLNMTLYHALYDLVFLFGYDIPWYLGRGAYLWQQSIAMGFVFLAGAGARLSRDNLRRGLVTLAGAFVVSAVAGFMGQPIYFGVLHLLGCCMLLCHFLRPLWERVSAPVGTALCGGLFLLCRGVPRGYLGIGELRLAALPRGLYSRAGYVFGFPDGSLPSADYVPLIPWVFLFFAGLFFFGWLLPRCARIEKSTPVLGAVGRNALLIYLLHQPVVYGVLWLWQQL